MSPEKKQAIKRGATEYTRTTKALQRLGKVLRAFPIADMTSAAEVGLLLRLVCLAAFQRFA